MIDWEHYRAEWISLCHQYQLYVITTSKHQPVPIQRGRQLGLEEQGWLLNPIQILKLFIKCASSKLCSLLLPACLLGCTASAAQRSLPTSPFASWAFLALVGSWGISGSGTHLNRRLGGTFIYRSTDAILLVFPEACKRSRSPC